MHNAFIIVIGELIDAKKYLPVGNRDEGKAKRDLVG
jgi:hypothetical protein